MEIRQKTTPLERYCQALKDAGCPRDQAENFLRFGVVLHPKQLEFASACRECDHDDGPKEVGYGGARGGGKSHASFAIAAVDDCQRCPGLKVLYLRKVGKAGAESFDDLRTKILSQFNERRGDYRFNQTKGILTFRNGSRIILCRPRAATSTASMRDPARAGPSLNPLIKAELR